jgi:predicted amidohydrolase
MIHLEKTLYIESVVRGPIFVPQRKIPVACVQLSAHDRDAFSLAWPRIVARVEEAAVLGAKLIVLPEGTVPGYVLGAAPVPEEQLNVAATALAAIARRFACTIVYGGAKNAFRNTYNAAIVIGPSGEEIGYAAKQFLWHFDRHWFAPGSALEPIDTPLGRLGLLVCADGRIPTIAATLVDRGAEILVMPTAWVTSGRDPRVLENVQADLMIGVRARENGVPFVAANKCGFERESVAYCGKSTLVDASGSFVARASERSEEILFAELELGMPRADVSRRTLAPLPVRPSTVLRTRIAFTCSRTATEIDTFEETAAEADAGALLWAEGQAEGEIEVAGVRALSIGSDTLRAPRALVPARLAGIDLFVVRAGGGDDAWPLAFARTRAAELRAYVVLFGDERACAIDPDGTLIAGTFEGFRMAAFGYDGTRTAATMVAPATDVLVGLRNAEVVRAASSREGSIV